MTDIMNLPHEQFIAATRAEFNATMTEATFGTHRRCGECSFECVSVVMLDAHYSLRHQ